MTERLHINLHGIHYREQITSQAQSVLVEER